MMLPPPVRCITGVTACVNRYRLRTLTRIESSHISTVDVASGAFVGVIALFTNTSSRPNSSTVPAISASMSAGTPMSHRIATAFPPAARIASTVS